MAKRVVETTEVISKFERAMKEVGEKSEAFVEAQKSRDKAQTALEELLEVLKKPVEYVGFVYSLLEGRLQRVEVLSAYDHKFVDLDKEYDPTQDDS
jgi:hypothetical protein